MNWFIIAYNLGLVIEVRVRNPGLFTKEYLVIFGVVPSSGASGWKAWKKWHWCQCNNYFQVNYGNWPKIEWFAPNLTSNPSLLACYCDVNLIIMDNDGLSECYFHIEIVKTRGRPFLTFVGLNKPQLIIFL